MSDEKRETSKGARKLHEFAFVDETVYRCKNCGAECGPEDETCPSVAVPVPNAIQQTQKPCYILGRATIERVANEGQLDTERIAFVAADELFHQNPYLLDAPARKSEGLRDAVEAAYDDCLRAAKRGFQSGDIDTPVRDRVYKRIEERKQTALIELDRRSEAAPAQNAAPSEEEL